MRITSMDIDNKEFKKSFRGYDIDDVNEFLNDVAESYEEIYKENSLYKEKLNNYEEKVDSYKKIEETIQNTLVLAQGAAEQVKQAAQKEADIIVKNANETAKKIIDKANDEVIKINSEYEKTRLEFERFKTIFRSFMNDQIRTFDKLDEKFKTEGNDKNNDVLLEDMSLEQDFLKPKMVEEENPLVIEELDEDTVSVQDSLNDFIARNNIDISKIQNTSLSEVDMLINK